MDLRFVITSRVAERLGVIPLQRLMQGMQRRLQGSCARKYSWRIDVTYSTIERIYMLDGINLMTGVQIKNLRKALRYTQARLAEEVGVTTNTIARYEREELTPSPPVQKLLKLLEMFATERKAA